MTKIEKGLLSIVLVTSVFWGSQEPEIGQSHLLSNGSSVSSGLVLSLRSSKSIYSLKENLILEAALSNDRSLEPVFVYDHLMWGKGCGMSLTIQDMKGNEIKTPMMMDALPLGPPAPNDLTILVGLGLGQFFGIGLAQPVQDFIAKPGQYRFRAAYASVLYPDDVDDRLRHLNVLWQGHTPIISQWITIEVTP